MIQAINMDYLSSDSQLFPFLLNELFYKFAKSYQVYTVGKIYSPKFSFFRKNVANIAILKLRPLFKNERTSNFTIY